MADPIDKATLVLLEAEAHERWRSAVEAIPAETAREDGWTLRDVVAHVAAWHRFAAERLSELAAGGGEKSVDADVVNAEVRTRAAQQSWEEIAREAEAARAEFLRAVEEFPAEMLRANDGLAAFLIGVNGADHYEEHMDDFAI
ncbi:MAG TPA: maleylpyruvate isomerase N-terminal domain-containing protein [Dehalococcoidia bacterium]|nr:maleylpyruvate isomerase N-terminal domain-containing protein [Dehalococcoidia bacterium]